MVGYGTAVANEIYHVGLKMDLVPFVRGPCRYPWSADATFNEAHGEALRRLVIHHCAN